MAVAAGVVAGQPATTKGRGKGKGRGRGKAKAKAKANAGPDEVHDHEQVQEQAKAANNVPTDEPNEIPVNQALLKAWQLQAPL